jgi:hypothetical protein
MASVAVRRPTDEGRGYTVGRVALHDAEARRGALLVDREWRPSGKVRWTMYLAWR